MSFMGGLLFAFFASAGTSTYQVQQTVTIRHLAQGVLEKAIDLQPGAVIRFDDRNVAGSMSYRNREGRVSRSHSGWFRGIKIESGISSRQRRRWNNKHLFMSTTHTHDVGRPGQIERERPGRGERNPPRRRHNDTTTEYFTYKARSINRSICKMEGTMIVGGVLYVWTSGKCRRADVQCRYGIGNRNNCLTPCKSIAADKRYWSNGQKVYIAKYDGKNCPSTGQRMNGYFTVADVGSRIKGKRRFDIFTGICVSQSGGVCHRHAR